MIMGVIIVCVIVVPAIVEGLSVFENLYDTIYMEKDKEQEKKVCSRTLERQALFFEVGGLEFSDFSCSKLFELEKGNFDEFIVGKVKSKEVHEKWVERVVKIMKFEREMLQFEDDLRMKTENMSIFSNRFMGDGAYDLINDLDDIDEVLFGEKHTRPKPSFSFKKSNAFSDTEEEWQDGFEEEGSKPALSITGGMSSNPNDYSDDDGSIAGNLANMKEVYADGKQGAAALSSISQAAECNSTRFFQLPFLNLSLPDLGDLNSQSVKKGSIPITKTEVEINKEELIGEKFSALEEKIITETPCKDKMAEDAKKYDIENLDQSNLVKECKIIKNEFWGQRFDAIRKAATIEPEKSYYMRILRAIDQWNQDFLTFFPMIVEQKLEYRELSEKSKCY